MAVTICSDLETKKVKSVTVSIFPSSLCHEMVGSNVMIFGFWKCWDLSQLFHSSFSPLSRGSFVPVFLLPWEWNHPLPAEPLGKLTWPLFDGRWRIRLFRIVGRVPGHGVSFLESPRAITATALGAGAPAHRSSTHHHVERTCLLSLLSFLA